MLRSTYPLTAKELALERKPLTHSAQEPRSFYSATTPLRQNPQQMKLALGRGFTYPIKHASPSSSSDLDTTYFRHGSVEISTVLGKGSSATVYLGQYKNNDSSFAVAVKNFTDADEGYYEYRMMVALETCQSPYLVRMIEYKTNFLVLEYMQNGTLFSYINDTDTCDQGLSLRLLADTSAGLYDMHQHGILHLDIKASNVLLTKDDEAKLGDFGIASHETNPIYGKQGTHEFIAPEIWMSANFSGYSKKSDIYSLGVLMLEIAAWDKFDEIILAGLKSKNRNDPNTFTFINWTLRLKLINQFIAANCPIDIGELIQDCMQLNYIKRPTAEDVKNRLTTMSKIHGEVRQLFFATNSFESDKIAGLVREYSHSAPLKLKPSKKQLELERQANRTRSPA